MATRKPTRRSKPRTRAVVGRRRKAVRRNPPMEVTQAMQRETTPEGAGTALAQLVPKLDKATVGQFHRWWERDIMGRGPKGEGDRGYHPEDLEPFWDAYRRERLILTGSMTRRNSFLGAVAEGAGTGIGLGLAGAAALPMVRKAFPGLMRGKANPEVVTHRSGLPIAYSDQAGRGSGTLKSGETVDYTVKGQRVSYAWTDRNGTAWKGTTSLKNFKAYTTDERTIVDKVLGRKSAHERGLWKPFPQSNPVVTRGRMAERYPGYVSIGTTPLREPSDYTQSLSHQLYQAGIKFAFQTRGNRASIFVHPDQVELAKSVYSRVTGRRSNPGPDADAMYETFHGVPPTGYEEIIEQVHYHENLAELGQLESVKVMPQYGSKKNRMLELDFSKADVLLCSNETGTQLYFRGGNQEVDVKALGLGDTKFIKDLMDLGVCYEVTYQTKKKFDNLKHISYYHALGERSKDTQPTLVYDTMNHELALAGGSYVNLDSGIND